MVHEGTRAYDFVFRATDDEGSLVRYEALFAYGDVERDMCYLVYADVAPDEAGEVGTYASIVVDEGQVERAAAQFESGSAPKKPPVIELAPIEDPQVWAEVERVLDEVEDEAE